jgi:hypothetical protein
MVRRLCRGLVGELALRKARNLEQGGGSGDGTTSDPVDETLKAMRHRQFFRSRGGEDDVANARVEAPGNRVHDG